MLSKDKPRFIRTALGGDGRIIFFTSLTIFQASAGVPFGFQLCPLRFSSVEDLVSLIIIYLTVATET